MRLLLCYIIIYITRPAVEINYLRRRRGPRELSVAGVREESALERVSGCGGDGGVGVKECGGV